VRNTKAKAVAPEPWRRRALFAPAERYGSACQLTLIGFKGAKYEGEGFRAGALARAGFAIRSFT
jgi:hypothetical protein